MALDFLKLADSKLAKEYSGKPPKDPMPKRREKLVAGINRALAQLQLAEEDSPSRGWYSTKNSVTRATLRLGSRPLIVDGRSEFFVPRNRAAEFYEQARASAEKGELDNAIRAVAEGNQPKKAKQGQERARSAMDREKLYQRNLKRYGKERADELRHNQSRRGGGV